MSNPSLLDRITFVAAVNNREILAQNLLASPIFSGPHDCEILIQENFTSASKAYNQAIQRAANDLLIFVHQDVLLPEAWLLQLEKALSYLSGTDPDWGVLGCWGAKQKGQHCGHIYSSGLGVLGAPFERPVPVQTLDEAVLLVRKGSNLRFDESLPHYHLYGTDICLRAATRGLKSYAISAFCVHNTSQLLELPREFYDCYAHVKMVWKDLLPIQTPCIRISRFDAEVYRRKLEDFCRGTILKRRHQARRVSDPIRILAELKQGQI